jgi:hypothetical protein
VYAVGGPICLRRFISCSLVRNADE